MTSDSLDSVAPSVRRELHIDADVERLADVRAAVREVARACEAPATCVDDLVQAMGGTGVSKSQVSRLCQEIDVRVGAFLDRPIEGEWPYLWIDATYVKVRQDGRIVSVAVIVAVGVNSDGRREVRGMDVGPSEAETFWTDFLRKLARRGLRGVKLVISDAHEGIKASVAKVMNATWQRCRVHFMRNVLAHAGRSGRRVVSAFIATAFAQDDAEAARQHGVNESLVHTWKANFLDAGRARLAGERQDHGQAALERENDRLKRIVAEKELELDISRKVRRL